MHTELEEYRDILDNLYDGVYFVNFERKITYWNKAAEKITGFSSDEVVGTHCWDNILKHVDENGKFLCTDGCPLSSTIKDGNIREINVFFHHKEGYRVPVFIKSLPLREKTGKIIGAIEIFSDSIDREKILEKIKDLEKLAMLDQLTQLPNRRFLDNNLESSYRLYKSIGKEFAVIFIDIDNFKNFNDVHGHDLGDLVLKNIAKTLSLNLRNEDIVGRWGGEEFISIVNVSDYFVLKNITHKLLSLIKRTEVHTEDKQTLSVTASIGGSIINPQDTIESLIQRADKLMYKSKANGKDRATIE